MHRRTPSLVRLGDADALVCDLEDEYHNRLHFILMPAPRKSRNLLKTIRGEGMTVSPFLHGPSVRILTLAAIVRRIMNMTAVASANALFTVAATVTNRPDPLAS